MQWSRLTLVGESTIHALQLDAAAAIRARVLSMRALVGRRVLTERRGLESSSFRRRGSAAARASAAADMAGNSTKDAACRC